jgi:hypothetical protein
VNGVPLASLPTLVNPFEVNRGSPLVIMVLKSGVKINLTHNQNYQPNNLGQAFPDIPFYDFMLYI